MRKSRFTETQIVSILREHDAGCKMAASGASTVAFATSCSTSIHPTIFHARSAIEAWRIDYYDLRPHTALDGLTPAEFIEHHRITSNSRSAGPDYRGNVRWVSFTPALTNTRDMKDGDRFEECAKRADGCRITYAQLTAARSKVTKVGVSSARASVVRRRPHQRVR